MLLAPIPNHGADSSLNCQSDEITALLRNRYNLRVAMRRRGWILSVLFVTACGRKASPPVFAPTVADVWQLRMTQNFPAGSAPEPIGKYGAREWWRASYQGPGAMTAELYELAAPAAGLDLVQRWRPLADTVVWYTPRYFVVVKWQSTDRSAVAAFIRALQKQFADEK